MNDITLFAVYFLYNGIYSKETSPLISMKKCHSNAITVTTKIQIQQNAFHFKSDLIRIIDIVWIKLHLIKMHFVIFLILFWLSLHQGWRLLMEIRGWCFFVVWVVYLYLSPMFLVVSHLWFYWLFFAKIVFKAHSDQWFSKIW